MRCKFTVRKLAQIVEDFFLKTYKRLFKISKRCKDVLRPVFQDALLTNCRSQLKNFQRSEAQTFVSKQPESLSFVMKLECFVDREVVFFEKLESFAEFSVCSQLVSTFLFWCLKLKLRWFLQDFRTLQNSYNLLI